MAAAPDNRSPADVRRDIEAHRAELTDAVDSLREEVGKATDIAGKLRANLPVVAAGALGAGFVLAGGIGATARFLARRGREGNERVRLGRYALIDRE
jgi:hypothetical protein